VVAPGEPGRDRCRALAGGLLVHASASPCTSKSRSGVIQDALRYWLDSQAQAALVREYEAGYRRKPEGRREIKAAEAAAVRLLATDDW